jgi:hypothetical protein
MDLFKEELQMLSNSHVFYKKEVDYPLASVFSDLIPNASNVKLSNPVEVGDGGKVYYTYPSFIIESKHYNNEVIEGFSATLGMLVNYNKNEYTIYTGATAAACLNLSIFGAENLFTYSILGDIANLPDHLKLAEDKMFDHLQRIKLIKERLENTTYSTLEFKNRKGKLLSDMSIPNLDYLKSAEDLMRTSGSIYYDMPNSDWKLLQACTDSVSDKLALKQLKVTLELEQYFL